MSEVVERFLASTGDDIHALDTEAAKRKAAFHRTGNALLTQIARDLLLRATEFKISSNKGGPGVGGEVSMRSPRIEITLYSNNMGQGLELLYRSVNEGRTGYNNWMLYRELEADYDGCIERFKRLIERVAA